MGYSRNNKGRIPQVLNKKVKGKCPTREAEIKRGTTGHERYHTQRKVKRGEQLRKIIGKSRTDGEAWMSDDKLEVEEKE